MVPKIVEKKPRASEFTCLLGHYLPVGLGASVYHPKGGGGLRESCYTAGSSLI